MPSVFCLFGCVFALAQEQNNSGCCACEQQEKDSDDEPCGNAIGVVISNRFCRSRCRRIRWFCREFAGFGCGFGRYNFRFPGYNGNGGFAGLNGNGESAVLDRCICRFAVDRDYIVKFRRYGGQLHCLRFLRSDLPAGVGSDNINLLFCQEQDFAVINKGRCIGGRYREIRLPNKLQKRPFVNQDMIDMRISNLLNAKSMGEASFYSLTHAIEMHSEAFDSRNTLTLFRTFWTALETLFANYSSNGVRDNVINSVLAE